MIMFFTIVLITSEDINITLSPGLCILMTIMLIVAISMLSIFRRLCNYRNFNFERTCYAIIHQKYMYKTKNQKGRTRYIYYVDLQINNNKYIQGVNIEHSKYFALTEKDKVIAVSFDGYKIDIVNL